MANIPLLQVLTAAEKIKNTWTATPTFVLGDIDRIAFQRALDKVVELDAGVESTRTQLLGLTTERDDAANALWDLVTRARSGFRAVYGPDSKEYEQAGGTRRSERRAPRRKATATTATA